MSVAGRSSALVRSLRIAYRTDGQGPPLLLLHGMGGRGDDFDHCGRRELAARFTTLAPDARGHGESDAVAGDGRLLHADIARDTLALLDALGLDQVRAIGVSMGGNALLHLAEIAPARLEAMVLVSSVARFPDRARAIMRATDPDDRRRQDELAPLHRGGHARARAILAHMRALADDHDDMAFTADRLARIAVPTLVVHGSADPLYDHDDVAGVAKGLANGALVVVEAGGHSPVFLERAAGFVETCLAFFDVQSAKNTS